MPEKKDQNDHVLSAETKKKVESYERRRKEYKKLVEEFFDANQAALSAIDDAREDMNNALDEAKKAMREDAETVPIEKVQRILFHDFDIQKKKSEWFQPEMFVQLLKNCGQYDAALGAGILSVNTTVDGDRATEWLQKNGLYDQFKVSLDGKELTPAIKGPKPVLAFGSSK